MKICACGAAVVLMLVNGALVETCERTGLTACRMPGTEWLHAQTQEPERSPAIQPFVTGSGSGHSLTALTGTFSIGSMTATLS